MLRIGTERQAVGTAGAVVERPEGPCLLSCRHVVPVDGDVVWAWSAEGERLGPVARVAGGVIGRLMHDGRARFVDVAVARLLSLSDLPALLRSRVSALHRFDRLAAPQRDATVLLPTGLEGRRGVVVDDQHYDEPLIDGERHRASGQLLVTSDTEGQPFSSPGDSGAVIFDASGCAVGLLWGHGEHGSCATPALAVALALRSIATTHETLASEAIAP